jgi:hypothetical protein
MSTYTSEPGTRLAGRYRLVDQKSAGSGWTMWKAMDETLARPVSVLTFASGFPLIPEVVTAARAASRLTDPRLAQVFDVEDGGDQAYIVMEWVAGDTLADLLTEGPLDPARACVLIGEAAQALSGAHAAGQAHLLLTPQSLRWTRSSGVKITGLGIDAALAGIGLAGASDPALTDTKDLAGLLYAALTGYWPCKSQTGLPDAPVSDGEVCTPRQVSADVPSAIDAVVTRALLQRPVRQGPPILTPSAFADALSSVAPPVPLPEPAPPISRNSFDGFDGGQQGYGAGGYQGTGYSGGGHQGGYPDGNSYADQGGYGPRGGYGPNPDDPSTWNTRGGAAAYQRGYPPARSGGASRAVIGIVAVLVVSAIVLTALAISGSLGNSSGNPQAGGGSGPSGKASNSAPAPAAAVLNPVSAQSFNVLGSSPTPEDPADATNPLTGKSPAWHTQRYDGPNFANLKKGDGYLIDMGQDVTLSSVQVQFATPGDATAQIYVSDTTSTQPGSNTWPQPGYTAVTQPAQVSGDYTFNVNSSTKGRYVIIWFTSLPTGANLESIAKVVVRGAAANGAG